LVEVIDKDTPLFSKFDTTINSNFSQSIKDAISRVYEIKSDTVIIDEMSAKTDLLLSVLGECNKAYSTIAFFVRKAFPGDKNMANIFGANDIANVRKSQEKMAPFMHILEKNVANHRDTLITAGCNEDIINSIPNLRERLLKANSDQEIFKNERSAHTRERIIRLNELYRKVATISEIAQIIFADNEPMLKKYKLPSPVGSTKNSDNLLAD
jgi:uncharacterized protein (UPF0305 family)